MAVTQVAGAIKKQGPPVFENFSDLWFGLHALPPSYAHVRRTGTVFYLDRGRYNTLSATTVQLSTGIKKTEIWRPLTVS